MTCLTRFCSASFLMLLLFKSLPLAETSDDLSTNITGRHIKFYLYPKPGDGNYREEIRYKIGASLKKSSYKPNQLTVFLIHGYNQNADSPKFKIILDAYVNSSFGGNYIIMDWNELAGHVSLPTDNLSQYPMAVSNVPVAGDRLAKFIGWLVSSRVLDPTRVHLIGMSLGAHVVGEAGRRVAEAMGGFKLTRITGLDPAGPLFWPPDTSRNIGMGDAHFVDVIHTNAYEFGEKTTEGHADFIVNNGINQPGCDIVTNIVTSCSHNFAEAIFAKSFSISYFGCKCSPSTGDLVGFQQCREHCQDPVRVGLYTPHSARGVYSVTTEDIQEHEKLTSSLD